MHAWVCTCRPSIPLGASILGRRASPEPFPLSLVLPQKEPLGQGAVLWDRWGPVVTYLTRGESFLGAGLPATPGPGRAVCRGDSVVGDAGGSRPGRGWVQGQEGGARCGP